MFSRCSFCDGMPSSSGWLPSLRAALGLSCSLSSISVAMASVPWDGRAGGAIEAQLGQDGEFFRCLHAFGDDRQADVVGDAAQPLEEGLVAGLGVDGADEAAVHLRVVEADAMQAADFAELSAEVLDPQAAAKRPQGVAEGMEFIEVLEGADFGDFQPEAGGQFLAAGDLRLQARSEEH